MYDMNAKWFGKRSSNCFFFSLRLQSIRFGHSVQYKITFLCDWLCCFFSSSIVVNMEYELEIVCGVALYYGYSKMYFGFSSIVNIFSCGQNDSFSSSALRARETSETFKWICSNDIYGHEKKNQFTNIIEIISATKTEKTHKYVQYTWRNWMCLWWSVWILPREYVQNGILSSSSSSSNPLTCKCVAQEWKTFHVQQFVCTCISIQSIDFVFNIPFSSCAIMPPLYLLPCFCGSLSSLLFCSFSHVIFPNTQLDQFTSTPLWSVWR